MEPLLMEPTQVTAGDSWKWSRDAGEYSASNGWALSYTIKSGSQCIAVNGVASGSTWNVTVLPAVTRLFVPGVAWWQCKATKGADVFTIDRGSFRIAPDLAASEGYDPRSHVKKVLDAIEATLEGTATREEQELDVDGYQLSLRTPEQLLVLRDRYKAEYQQEIAAERMRKGLGFGRNMVTRFVAPR